MWRADRHRGVRHLRAVVLGLAAVLILLVTASTGAYIEAR